MGNIKLLGIFFMVIIRVMVLFPYVIIKGVSSFLFEREWK